MNAVEFFNANETGRKVRDKIGIVLQQDLASELANKVLVDSLDLDVFAARLAATGNTELIAAFAEAFPSANAGTLLTN